MKKWICDMANISYYDRILTKKFLEDKEKLRHIAERITKIPSEFVKSDGSLDLDKVHLKLIDYHKGKQK